MRVTPSKTRRTNIISTSALDPDGKMLALVTYQRSNTTSKWVYSIETLDANSLEPLRKKSFEESYNDDKRRVAISKKYIAVHTKYFIELYDKNSLNFLKSQQHQLTVIKAIAVSANSQYVGIAGDGVQLWDTYSDTLIRIAFTNPEQWFHFIHFTRTRQQLIAAKLNSLQIYIYNTTTNQFDISSISESIPQATYINSLDSNPINSDQLLVGLQDLDPHYYSISQNVFFKKLQQSQPNLKQNIKRAVYMPDGRGFVSADLRGFGLWSDEQQSLRYFNQPIIGNVHPSVDGKYLYNFIWEEARKYQIQVRCNNAKFQSSCSCPSGYFWSVSALQCIPLQCQGLIGSTGRSSNNACQCDTGFKFNKNTGFCYLDCNGNNAFRQGGQPTTCICEFPFQWNIVTLSCQVSCFQFANTAQQTPTSINSTTNKINCLCVYGLQWDEDQYQCVCPTIYERLLNNECECIEGYSRNPSNGFCQINCTQINFLFTAFQNSGADECECIEGFYYVVEEGQIGCKRNCTLINNSVAEIQSFGGQCVCLEHFMWNGQNCVPNCTQATENQSIDPQNASNCLCSVNFEWDPRIAECTRNCSTEANALIQNSTAVACQCKSNFVWNEYLDQCEIQCQKIEKATQYRIKVDECECRVGFDWDKTYTKCAINCSEIDDGFRRISEDECQCKEGKVYNKELAVCEAAGSGLILGNFWITISIVGAGLVLLVILIAICRACCYKRREHKANESQQSKIVQEGQQHIDHKKLSLPGLYKRYDIPSHIQEHHEYPASTNRHLNMRSNNLP